MEAKVNAGLLGLFALCGLVMAGLVGFFAFDQGATGTAALTFAAVIYTATVATLARCAGGSATAAVLRTVLLLVGAAVALVGAVLLHPAGIRLSPAV
ncbi:MULTISPECIES: hypothetical protein [unclassified Streptomyces]|uniref:hypothetical protein n=1 Tax=unclassified Streptomyces TaxID=2593676 RepID=UPI0038063FB6